MHGVYVCMCGWVCVHAWVLSDCTHACIYIIIQRLSTWCALLKELLYIIARETLYITIMKPTTLQGEEKRFAILNIYGGPHIQVRHGILSLNHSDM